MKAHRIETTLTEDGTLIIKDLPFQAVLPFFCPKIYISDRFIV